MALPEEEALHHAAKKRADGLSALALFPMMFTTFCSFLFVVPMWSTLKIATTGAVSYFTSNVAYAVLAIPAIIVVVHLVHMRTKAPHRIATLVALVGPSLILLLVANGQYGMAIDKTDKLYASDCDTFLEKRTLQRSWEAAYTLYQGCLQNTSKALGYPVATLKQHFRIQDCEEYESERLSREPLAARRQGDWAYLRQLEEQHLCAGWCYQGEQLWASSVHQDACSTVVSQLLQQYVGPHAYQTSAMMLCVLASSTVLMVVVGPTLRRHGLDW